MRSPIQVGGFISPHSLFSTDTRSIHIFRPELNKKDQYDNHATIACPFLRRLWDVCSPEDASGGRAMESGSGGAGVGRVVD